MSSFCVFSGAVLWGGNCGGTGAFEFCGAEGSAIRVDLKPVKGSSDRGCAHPAFSGAPSAASAAEIRVVATSTPGVTRAGSFGGVFLTTFRTKGGASFRRGATSVGRAGVSISAGPGPAVPRVSLVSVLNTVCACAFGSFRAGPSATGAAVSLVTDASAFSNPVKPVGF